MEPASDSNPHPDWQAMLLQRRLKAPTLQASEHAGDVPTPSLPTEEIPCVPTTTAAAAAVSDRYRSSLCLLYCNHKPELSV